MEMTIGKDKIIFDYITDHGLTEPIYALHHFVGLKRIQIDNKPLLLFTVTAIVDADDFKGHTGEMKIEQEIILDNGGAKPEWDDLVEPHDGCLGLLDRKINAFFGLDASNEIHFALEPVALVQSELLLAIEQAYQ